MFVKAWGRNKAEVDLSFGRCGRFAMDRIRELEEWAQLAAQRAKWIQLTDLGEGCEGRSHCSAL